MQQQFPRCRLQSKMQVLGMRKYVGLQKSDKKLGGSYQEELISASIHSFPIWLGARADRSGDRGANPYLMLFSQQRCQGYLLLSCKRDGCAGFRTWEMLRLQSWLWAMRELCALLLGFWGVVLMWSDIALASCS